MNDDLKRRKAAFRVAFDFLEKWVEKMPAFASADKFWEQCWADCLQLGKDTDVLTQELLATAYWELERIWMNDRRDDA